MRILHLTLKEKWFEMVASGEKLEEYRDMKPYWDKRLRVWPDDPELLKTFDLVEFRHGYAKDAPIVLMECDGLTTGQGMRSWGAEPDVEYYIIKLGKILSIKNYKQ